MSNAKKEINSTEKLLNIIRGKDDQSFGISDKKKVPLFSPKIRTTKSSRGFFGKKIQTVGVDIEREFICLAKTSQSSDSKPFLTDKKTIRYNPELSFDSPEFKSLLKSSIIDFCGQIDDCNIWTKISTREVNVYFITIPRVPQKQLEKIIYWTAKKEGYIDEEKHIFDFEVQGEVVEQGNTKYSVMVYTAPREQIENIKNYFSEMGISLTGITTVPFAIQNIFRSKWMPSTEDVFASLYIGNNFSRIDVYHKENLVMTRGIKTGSGSSMSEAIASSVLERTGNLRLSHDEARKILSSLDSIPGSDQRGANQFNKTEILEMISPVWERLARQVDLTLKTSSIGYQKVEKIYILSSVTVDKSLLDYMSDQLGTKTEFFDPFAHAPSLSAAPLTISEKFLFSPALGFALSDNARTPNIIYTFQEKKKETNTKLIHKVALSAFIVALAACVVILIYQGARLTALRTTKVTLEKELSLFNPLLTKDQVRQAANDLIMQRKSAHRYAQKYMSLAAVEEITDLNNQNIRLISIKVADKSSAPKSDADKTQANEGVLIEGLVLDKNKALLDSDLTQYVIKLKNSPLFSNISVQKKEPASFSKTEVIHFILSARTGQ